MSAHVVRYERGIATLLDVEAIEAAIEAAGALEMPSSTYELLRRAVAAHADAPALSFILAPERHHTPMTWTYRELFARITQTANFFHRLGAEPGSVIAYVLPNLPETHAVIWGGQAAGIALALNPMLEGAALGALLAAARARILVTLAPTPVADLWGKLSPLLATLPSLERVVLVDLARHLGAGPAPLPEVPAGITVHEFASSIASEPSGELVSRRVFAPSDPSSWFCTGGTTGLPKIAMRTHGNEVANVFSAASVLGDGIGPGKVLFCGLPLFHVNAVLVTGLLPFSCGAHVLLGTPQGYRTPGLLARFWEIVARHRVNFFAGVPTVYSSLLEVPSDGHDLSSLQYALCGAAPMPTEVFRAFEARTGLKILEGYGLTEATCVSSVNPPRGERRVGSVGLRIPGQAMKTVVRDERGAYVRDCAVDEVGVVVVSGPNVFSGYLDPAQNETVWLATGDGRRWLDTGDLARLDADGYFWLTGRKKELIIRGGHNLDPAAIEEPLHRHPAVQVAAAIGRPDAHAGEVPVAYVQLRPGATATPAELLEHLRGAVVERAAVPRHVRIVSAMPLTAVGKIFKPALKRMEAKDALESALVEAGVRFRALTMVDDAARGFAARLELDGEDLRTPAARVLGGFSVAFAIVVGE